MELKPFKVQAVANLLGTTVDSVRRDTADAGIEIQRQTGDGPKTRLYTLENIFQLAKFRAKKLGLIPKRKVIMTVYAPKGGVGKTTLSSNLSVLFPLMGLKTLVVDLDFQANLSMSFGYDAELTEEQALEENIPVNKCINYHFGNLMPQWQMGVKPKLSEVLKKPFGEFGPHLIPSEVQLDRLEAMFTLDQLMNKQPEKTIAKFLFEGMSGEDPEMDLSDYDIIIFDAPPAKNQTTKGALLASDYVLAPVAMDRYSTKSVSYLSTLLDDMNQTHEKFPEMLVLGNFYDRNRLRVVAQLITLTDRYKDSWIDKTISSSEEFKKTISSDVNFELPLAVAKPTSNASMELRAVAQSLVGRMRLL